MDAMDGVDGVDGVDGRRVGWLVWRLRARWLIKYPTYAIFAPFSRSSAFSTER
jgi:hypothetical protein